MLFTIPKHIPEQIRHKTLTVAMSATRTETVLEDITLSGRGKGLLH